MLHQHSNSFPMQKTTCPVFEHKQQEPSQETGLHNSPSPTTTTANDHSPSSCQQPAAWLQADMVMLSTPPLLNCQLQRPLWQALRCSHSNTEGHLPCLGRGLGAIFTEIFYLWCSVTEMLHLSQMSWCFIWVLNHPFFMNLSFA